MIELFIEMHNENNTHFFQVVGDLSESNDFFYVFCSLVNKFLDQDILAMILGHGNLFWLEN